MADKINLGDIVLSTCGRDKGQYFVVTKVEGTNAFIADGRKRKLSAVKSKNIKHLKWLNIAIDNEIAIRLRTGQPVGNERLFKAIKSQIQKIQED